MVASIAKHSRSFGYEVSVVFLEEGPLIAALTDAGIAANAVPWTANRDDLPGAWRLWRWLRKHPADIAHVHSGGLTLRLVCRLAGVDAIVQHIHGRIIEPIGTSVSQLSFRGADAVIACSQAVADCLPQCRTQVIYAGVETGSHPPTAKVNTGPLKLGVLARLIPLKNVESLINATARLRGIGIEIQVEIAGSGPSESALRELATKLGVADLVRFIGWQVDVDRLLASWDLLVIPSLEEGFPIAALEAMAAAKPVLASRVGGLPEVVVDRVTGRLFPPGDTDALVQCIAELANDRQRLVVMGTEGWKRAHSLFSAERMTQQNAHVYDGLL
jgi:glycosyltransferase involved in cell wall biosynthesis